VGPNRGPDTTRRCGGSDQRNHMSHTSAPATSPADLFALADIRAGEYLEEMDLDRDFESRLLTTRYLFETVCILRNIADGRSRDHSNGAAFDADRLEMAEVLLPMLSADDLAMVRDPGTDVARALTVVLEGLHSVILYDYFYG